MIQNTSEALAGLRRLARIVNKVAAFCLAAATVLMLAAAYGIVRFLSGRMQW